MGDTSFILAPFLPFSLFQQIRLSDFSALISTRRKYGISALQPPHQRIQRIHQIQIFYFKLRFFQFLLKIVQSNFDSEFRHHEEMLRKAERCFALHDRYIDALVLSQHSTKTCHASLMNIIIKTLVITSNQSTKFITSCTAPSSPIWAMRYW